MSAVRVELFWMATKPAGCGRDEVPQFEVQVGPPALAIGAPRVLKSTPDDAVVSLPMIVLLMMLTCNESSREMPAPSQPATLLAMMLLVTSAEYQRDGRRLLPVVTARPSGKNVISDPFRPWKRIPPPLPLSAALPMIMLALICKCGPVPSPVPGAQSPSGAVPQMGSVSGAPRIAIPPPLVGIVGLVLWLNRIALCSMSPL